MLLAGNIFGSEISCLQACADDSWSAQVRILGDAGPKLPACQLGQARQQHRTRPAEQRFLEACVRAQVEVPASCVRMIEANFQSSLVMAAGHRVGRSLLGLSLCTASIYLCACSRPETQANAVAAPVPVVLTRSKSADVPIAIDALGTIEAYRTVEVVAQASGRIESVHFQEGATVNAGDLLFRIDDRRYRTTLNTAKARLQRNAARTQQAGSEVDRAKSLFEPGLLAPEEMEQVRTAHEALEAELKADRSTVREAELSLQYTEVRAPISGRTGVLLVHPGNVIKTAGETPLVTIRQTSPIFARLALAGQQLPALQAALAKGHVEVEVTQRNQTSPIETGKITLIDNQIDQRTAKFEVKAELANEQQLWWPGQAVDVRVIVEHKKNAVVIPESAIVYGQTGPYLFVEGQGHVKLTPVVIGPSFGELVVIERGLAAGANVVTDGQLRLTDGAMVEATTHPVAANVTVASETSTLRTADTTDAADATDANGTQSQMGHT